MARIMTMTERKEAEHRRYNEQQDNNLRVVLLKAKKEQRLTYSDIAEKAKVGVSTVRKALDVAVGLDSMELDKLRKVCFALGVNIRLCAE